MAFKILEINLIDSTVVVDWGWCTLNHHLPLAVVNDPNMPRKEIRQHIAKMEPERPPEVKATPEIKKLLQEDGGVLIESVDDIIEQRRREEASGSLDADEQDFSEDQTNQSRPKTF